jgi:hypothetical protein
MPLLTGGKLATIRSKAQLSVRALGRLVDGAPTSIDAMEKDKMRIPRDFALWMLSLEKWLSKNPPPKFVRRYKPRRNEKMHTILAERTPDMLSALKDRGSGGPH